MPRETYVLKKRPDGTHELVPRAQVSAWVEKHFPDRGKGYVSQSRAMERGSWVWRDGKLMPKRLAPPRMNRGQGLQVISDLEPYRNIAIDGKVIGGRRQHRDMLRAHNCVEVGNDPSIRKVKPPSNWDKVDRGLVDTIKHAMGKL